MPRLKVQVSFRMRQIFIENAGDADRERVFEFIINKAKSTLGLKKEESLGFKPLNINWFLSIKDTRDKLKAWQEGIMSASYITHWAILHRWNMLPKRAENAQNLTFALVDFR